MKKTYKFSKEYDGTYSGDGHFNCPEDTIMNELEKEFISGEKENIFYGHDWGAFCKIIVSGNPDKKYTRRIKIESSYPLHENHSSLKSLLDKKGFKEESE